MERLSISAGIIRRWKFSQLKDICLCVFFQKKCVWGVSVKQLGHTLTIYCSYLQLIYVWYWGFRHPFLKHLAFLSFCHMQLKTYILDEKTCWSWLLWSFIKLHSSDKNLWLIKSCAIYIHRQILGFMYKPPQPFNWKTLS